MMDYIYEHHLYLFVCIALGFWVTWFIFKFKWVDKYASGLQDQIIDLADEIKVLKVLAFNDDYKVYCEKCKAEGKQPDEFGVFINKTMWKLQRGVGDV